MDSYEDTVHWVKNSCKHWTKTWAHIKDIPQFTDLLELKEMFGTLQSRFQKGTDQYVRNNALTRVMYPKVSNILSLDNPRRNEPTLPVKVSIRSKYRTNGEIRQVFLFFYRTQQEGRLPFAYGLCNCTGGNIGKCVHVCAALVHSVTCALFQG